MQNSATTRTTLWSALRDRNLRLLWIGETISQLGDQFYLVGLPLVILNLTGSSVQFGLVLFIEGVPRAILMLLGGVITDRISPRRVMLYANSARLLITLILSGLIFSQTLQIWMLYIVAFCFGSVDAFFQPAFMAIIPALVEPEQFQSSNSLMQSSSQAILAVGPGVAGGLIGLLGFGAAMLLDALSFLVTTLAMLAVKVRDRGTISAIRKTQTITMAALQTSGINKTQTMTMMAVRVPNPTSISRKTQTITMLPVQSIDSVLTEDAGAAQTIRDIFKDVGGMISYLLNDPILRPYMLLILMVNLTLVGPTTVGVLVLARQFDNSSLALGIMLSAMGIGSVVGALATGMIKVKRFGTLYLSSIAVTGSLLALLGLVTPLWAIVLIIVAISFIIGFTNVLLLTWFDKQIPLDKLGRFMSVYVLLGVGLAPISNAMAGVAFSFSLSGTFLIAGTLQVLACIVAGFNPFLRHLEL